MDDSKQRKVRLVGWLGVLILGFVLVDSARSQGQPASEDDAEELHRPRKLPEEHAPRVTVGLPRLMEVALERNPQLQQARLAIEAARGTATQAGLYPNPTVFIGAEEIGPQGGIYTLPQINIPIVTAGKLELSEAVAKKAIDLAQLDLLRQRLTLVTDVRKGYVSVMAAQQRLATVSELVSLTEKSLDQAQKLREGKLIAELDVVPFQIDLEQFRADRDAAEQQLDAAWRQLVARIGVPDAARIEVEGTLLQPLPDYDFESARARVLQSHPTVLAAEVRVQRAKINTHLQHAQAVPNITVGAGYQRNFNDRLNQATFQVQVPIPLFNKNQGNIHKAHAQLGQSFREVERVRNDLSRQLAAAFGNYAAARKQADRYRESILPKAERAYELSLKAFQGGQFQYLRVVQAQRAVSRARLEYLRLRAQAWIAASDIAALLVDLQLEPMNSHRSELTPVTQ